MGLYKGFKEADKLILEVMWSDALVATMEEPSLLFVTSQQIPKWELKEVVLVNWA